MMKLWSSVAAIGAISLNGLACAQDTQPTDGWHGVRALGIGVATVDEPYLGLDDDTTVYPFPLFAFDTGRVWVQGKQLGVQLTPEGDGPWEVSAILDYRFQGYEADESLIFTDMEDRDGTLEAGAVVTYRMGNARLLTQTRFDILDTHGGFDLSGQAEYEWKPSQATSIKPYVGLLWQSAELVDYYYGVRSDEALLNIALDTGPTARPAYSPGETMNPYVGIQVRQFLSRQLFVVGFAHHHFLPDEVSDSPLVDSDGQTSVGIAIGRPFL